MRVREILAEKEQEEKLKQATMPTPIANNPLQVQQLAIPRPTKAEEADMLSQNWSNIQSEDL